MLISSTYNGTDLKAVNSLKRRLPVILEAVRLKMDELNLMLQMNIQTEKLSGQVLNQVTGKGVASVHYVPAVIEGDRVVGGVEAGGGPAFYMRINNYGTDAPYEILPVNKKALAFFGPEGPTPRNKVIMSKILRGFTYTNPRSAWRKRKAYASFEKLGGVVVKKVIHPPIKERNFMESTAEEMQDTFTAGLKQAVSQGLKSS